MKVSIIPLGAGQEVGRSCILIDFAGERRVLLDCGIHMGHNDKRKYPDFQFLLDKYQKPSLNELLDAVLISHFHLDHCAALPVLTEDFGYTGPLYASDPTKAIIPYMLEDFMKVCPDSFYIYTKEKIANCSRKIKVIFLNQTLQIGDLKVTTYYAGHVLGAVMFDIQYKDTRVVYTGDFNSAADRHLGACQIDKIKPDVLISEGTYATVNRDWKKEREMQFSDLVKKTFERRGKVLIPVFALGRAQEIFALIEDLWEKCGWDIPVYFSAGLTEKVRFFYKVFVNWTNHNIRDQLLGQKKSVFDLKHIQKFERSYARLDMPMLVIATPGMLHAGTSLEVFKDFCEDARNLLLIPGYCVSGTLGNKLLGGAREVWIEGKQYNVKMEVSKMSFSAHADNRGILNLVHHLSPKHLVLVHGEKERVEELKRFVTTNLKIQSHCPANFETLDLTCEKDGTDTGFAYPIDLPEEAREEGPEWLRERQEEAEENTEVRYVAQLQEGTLKVTEKMDKGDLILKMGG